MSQNANSPARIDTDTDTDEVILNFLSFFIYYLCLFSYSYILYEESQKVKTTRRVSTKFIVTKS